MECFLPELPPPSSGTELFSLCSHEHQPEFSLLLFSGWRAAEVPDLHSQEKRRGMGAFLLSQHLLSPCSSNISRVPTRRSIAGAGNAEAWEKTLTVSSCCLLFLSHVPTEQQQSLPGVPWSSWDTWKKNTGRMLEGSSCKTSTGLESSEAIPESQNSLGWKRP